jgi:hypothetical protein
VEGLDFPLEFSPVLSVLDDFKINSTEAFASEESDYYQFSNYVPIMSVSIDKVSRSSCWSPAV